MRAGRKETVPGSGRGMVLSSWTYHAAETIKAKHVGMIEREPKSCKQMGGSRGKDAWDNMGTLCLSYI